MLFIYQKYNRSDSVLYCKTAIFNIWYYLECGFNFITEHHLSDITTLFNYPLCLVCRMTSWMWWPALTSLKRLSRGSGSTLSLLLSTTWLAFLLLPVSDCDKIYLNDVLTVTVIIAIILITGVIWAVSVHRCISSHWSGVTAMDGLCCDGAVICLCGFVLPSTQMVMRYLVLCWGLFICVLCFSPFWVYSSKTLFFFSNQSLYSALSYLLCLCSVTLSPVLRSWRPDWVTAGGRAACLMSASTSAWARCVVPPPNSAFWTASSTTAASPSTPCALTNTHSTAWCSVSPTNTHC